MEHLNTQEFPFDFNLNNAMNADHLEFSKHFDWNLYFPIPEGTLRHHLFGAGRVGRQAPGDIF